MLPCCLCTGHQVLAVFSVSVSSVVQTDTSWQMQGFVKWLSRMSTDSRLAPELRPHFGMLLKLEGLHPNMSDAIFTAKGDIKVQRVVD